MIDPCRCLGRWYAKDVTLVGTLSEIGPANGYQYFRRFGVTNGYIHTSSEAISTSETKLALTKGQLLVIVINWPYLLAHGRISPMRNITARAATPQLSGRRPIWYIHLRVAVTLGPPKKPTTTLLLYTNTSY